MRGLFSPWKIPLSKKKAADRVCARSLSVRSTEHLVSRMKKEALVPEDADDGENRVDYAALLSDELSLSLGRKVVLTDHAGKGRLELYYDNADDRESLVSLLKTLRPSSLKRL